MTLKSKREECRNNILSAWNNFQPAEIHLNAEEVETWLTRLETVLVGAGAEQQPLKMIAKIND